MYWECVAGQYGRWHINTRLGVIQCVHEDVFEQVPDALAVSV